MKVSEATSLVAQKLGRFVKYRGRYPTYKPIIIGNVTVGRGHPAYVIAEIGINHNGSLEIAKKLIDAAAAAGAQAVKFQKRTIDVVYSKEELAKPRAVDRGVLENAIARGVLPQEATQRLTKSDFKDSTNGDLKRALEFTREEYQEIFKYAHHKGLHCFASPWDEESVIFLESLHPEVYMPCYKVASACLTDSDLLRKIKMTGKPVILSTGMSTLGEIAEAVSILGTENLVIMHTVSTYPSEEKDLNLRAIMTLKRTYPTVIVGYSGHERGIAPTIAAAFLGALVIERHITLDRKMFGTDQSASLEPGEFADLIRGIREVDASHGDGVKRVIEAEVPIRAKLRRK